MDADSISVAEAVMKSLVLFRLLPDNTQMVTDFSQIEQSALSLPELDRAKLAGALLRSLPAAVDDDPQLAATEWANVVLARSESLHRGETQFVAGHETIDELRTMISNSQSTDQK
jgi:Putative addiction module component